MKLKDFKKAIQSFNRAIEINPNCLGAINDRAAALFRLGKFDESIKSLGKLSMEHESSQILLNNKALTFLEHQRFKEAMDCFDKCIAIKKGTKEYVQALAGKANTFFMTKRYKEALPLYEKVLAIDPKNKESLSQKGNTLLALEKVEQALEIFKKAMEIDPQNGKAVGSAANCLFELKRYEEAFVFYGRAIKLVEKDDPDPTRVYNYMNCNKACISSMVKNRQAAFDKCHLKQEEKAKMDDFYKILLRFSK